MPKTCPPNPCLNPHFFEHLHVANFIHKVLIINCKIGRVVIKHIYIAMFGFCSMYDLEVKILQHVNSPTPFSISI